MYPDFPSAASTGPLSCLPQQLGVAQRLIIAYQRQIQSLALALEASQAQVATLERECALHQQRYIDQGHALSESAERCRDLRSRLWRQQQYNLQLKSALEKSFPDHHIGQSLLASLSQTPLTSSTTVPIPPWSEVQPPPPTAALPAGAAKPRLDLPVFE